jgi:IclR family acetate operon transcriptional repressor
VDHRDAVPQGTQAIDRAAQLLTLVLDSEHPLGVSDLASAAELPKSTASRLVSSLERHGLVRRNGARGKVGPGPAILRFAHRGVVDRNLVELCQAPLEAVAEISGETVNLAVPGPAGVEHLAQVESRHYLGISHWVGRRVPYHCSANGKALLAFGAAGATAGPLEALTSRTITEPALFAAELERIRREGYATAVDELELGLSAVAAPVLDDSGRAVAALSVSGPTLRLSPRRVTELRPIVIKQARALGELLGQETEGVHAA